MLTVLIVDDHPLIREALRDVVGRLLAGRGWEAVCLEAASLAQARECVAANAEIDLILLDLHIPGSRDCSGLRALRATAPATPIVVVSAFSDAETIRRAMLYGASGFIPKSVPKEAMVAALQTVLAGGVHVPPERLDGALHNDLGGTAPGPACEPAGTLALTPRQATVLARLVEGKSNKEIARELAISDITVKVHVTAILRSLGVATRAQAIVAVRGEDGWAAGAGRGLASGDAPISLR